MNLMVDTIDKISKFCKIGSIELYCLSMLEMCFKLKFRYTFFGSRLIVQNAIYDTFQNKFKR